MKVFTTVSTFIVAMIAVAAAGPVPVPEAAAFPEAAPVEARSGSDTWPYCDTCGRPDGKCC